MLPNDILYNIANYLDNKSLGELRMVSTNFKNVGDDWKDRERSSRGLRKMRKLLKVIKDHGNDKMIECIKHTEDWANSMKYEFEENEVSLDIGSDLLLIKGMKYNVTLKIPISTNEIYIGNWNIRILVHFVGRVGWQPRVVKCWYPEDLLENSTILDGYHYIKLCGNWIAHDIYGGGDYKAVNFMMEGNDDGCSLIIKASPTTSVKPLYIRTILRFFTKVEIEHGSIGWVHFTSHEKAIHRVSIFIPQLSFDLILEKVEIDYFWKDGDRPANEIYIPIRQFGEIPAFDSNHPYGLSMLISAIDDDMKYIECDVKCEVWKAL